jgi:hypothetical protein
MDISVGQYRNPADRQEKFNAYKKLLIAQSNLQRRSEMAFKEKRDREGAPYIRKIDELPRFASTADELADIDSQKVTALNNAKELLPLRNDARDFINGLDFKGNIPDPINPSETLNTYALFNRYFPKLKERVKNIKSLTPSSLKEYYSRTLDNLVDDLIPSKKLKDTVIDRLNNIGTFYVVGPEKDRVDELINYIKVTPNIPDQDLDDMRRELLDVRTLDDADNVVLFFWNALIKRKLGRAAAGGPAKPGAPAPPAGFLGSILKRSNKAQLEAATLALAKEIDPKFDVSLSPTVEINIGGFTKDYDIKFLLDTGTNANKENFIIDVFKHVGPPPFLDAISKGADFSGILTKNAMNYLSSASFGAPKVAVSGTGLRFPSQRLNPSQASTRDAKHPHVKGQKIYIPSLGIMPPQRRRVIIGDGIDTVTPNFFSFGKFRISREMLLENVLSVYYQKWGRPSSKILKRNLEISNDFKNLLYKTIKEKKIDVAQYFRLSSDERNVYKTLIKRAGLTNMLDEAFGNDGYNEDIGEAKEAMERFELVKGQILAGNNNPAIVKELVQLLDILSKYDKISTYSRNKLLSEIIKVS